MATTYKKDKLTYEQAMARLNTIVTNLENGVLELDHLTTQLAEAKQLIAFCRTKLTAVEKEVNKILRDGDEDKTETNSKVKRYGEK